VGVIEGHINSGAQRRIPAHWGKHKVRTSE
jgi:hypothetical protein